VRGCCLASGAVGVAGSAGGGSVRVSRCGAAAASVGAVDEIPRAAAQTRRSSGRVASRTGRIAGDTSGISSAGSSESAIGTSLHAAIAGVIVESGRNRLANGALNCCNIERAGGASSGTRGANIGPICGGCIASVRTSGVAGVIGVEVGLGGSNESAGSACRRGSNASCTVSVTKIAVGG
jgi:hypothetical protein